MSMAHSDPSTRQGDWRPAIQGWNPSRAFARAVSAAALVIGLLVAPASAQADADEPRQAVSSDEVMAGQVDFILPGLNFTEDLGSDQVDRAHVPASAMPTGALGTSALGTSEFPDFIYGGADDMTFSLPGTGLSGFITLDQIEPSPLFAGVKPVSDVIGDATLNWRLSESFALSTTVGRRLAESDQLAVLGVVEETVGGGFTYFVSPRLQMTAEGILATPDLTVQSLTTRPGEAEATLMATYQFLPFFAGSVNYTYEMKDPLLMVGNVDAESTVSFTLIGKF